MPSPAFADMRVTLKGGESWTGLGRYTDSDTLEAVVRVNPRGGWRVEPMWLRDGIQSIAGQATTANSRLSLLLKYWLVLTRRSRPCAAPGMTDQ